MKCREEEQQTVMTIFYEVDPSQVSDLTGDFGKAFKETCEGKTEEVKKAWSQALKDVAGIAGFDSRNCGDEAELINKVAADVRAVLGFTPSKDFDDFVGIGAHIMEIKSKLVLQSKKVKVIGILGPAGIGKTSAARVLYNQLSPDFPFSTFLENIRGSYDKPCRNHYQLKLRFQKNLLSQIFKQRDIEVLHLGRAQEMLSDKKVLVVLDEVDNWWQLEQMEKQREWVGPGSMIIITTEDRRLLDALGLGIDHIYEMRYPTSDESLQIFCQSAFGQNSPDKGFESLAREVTILAGDLPLGLRVMGSYLRGMSMDGWIRALPWLRSTLNTEIESTLRFSYDALSDNERTLFLYIACYFDGFEVHKLKMYFANSSLEVNHGLEVLAQKSLVFIQDGRVKMHRLLQQMGREIVKKQYMKNPAYPHFLTDAKGISNVLDEDTATGNVLGIMFCDEIQISKNAFEGMNNLQFLVIEDNTFLPEGLDYLPNKLILLCWELCPLKVWPSKFSGKFLVELSMRDNEFEMLWEGIERLPCLKILDLSNSWNLKKIPDLSEATSLEELCLRDCRSLLELPSSIGKATKLYRLDISFCRNIKDFPNVSDSIIELKLCETGIMVVPDWIEKLIRLRKLIMYGCKMLQIISPSISKLENLEFLGLHNYVECVCGFHCHDEDNDGEEIDEYGNFFEAIIEWGPDFKRSWRLRSDFDVHYILPICVPEKAFTSPISLRLRGNGIKTIPDCIRRLSGLVKLDVRECRELVALPLLPDSLLSLQIAQTFEYNQGGAGTTEQQQSGSSIDPQSGTGLISYTPPTLMQSYGNPMHQGGDKPQNMLPVPAIPQSLNPRSVPQQLPSMQLSQVQCPMQPPQHVRPSMQISQPSEQGVSLQSQWQMQMMQQTHVQPYYHPPQQQDLSHVQQQQPQQQAVQGQQGAGTSQRQESGMSLHDYLQFPGTIQVCNPHPCGALSLLKDGNIDDIISSKGVLVSTENFDMNDVSSENIEDDFIERGLDDKFWWECPETLPERFPQSSLPAKRKLPTVESSGKRAKGENSSVDLSTQSSIQRGLGSASLPPSPTPRDTFRQHKSVGISDCGFVPGYNNIPGSSGQNLIDLTLGPQSFYSKSSQQQHTGHIHGEFSGRGVYDQKMLPNQSPLPLVQPPSGSHAIPQSSDPLSNQSSPFNRGSPSSGGPIRHMPPHPSAIPQYSSNPYASLSPRTSTVQTFGYNQGGGGTTEQQQSGPAIDPQSGTGMTSYSPPTLMQPRFSRPFYGNPMHQGGDTMLPLPQSLDPYSIPQQLLWMQLSHLQRPMQPHVRPSMQISQPSEQGVSLQNQYQIPLHLLQMMQQTQVQPYYHPPQQQEISHVQQQTVQGQQGVGTSQRQESGMSLQDYMQSPEIIQALLSNSEKLCKLLEQNQKLMQMLQKN